MSGYPTGRTGDRDDQQKVYVQKLCSLAIGKGRIKKRHKLSRHFSTIFLREARAAKGPYRRKPPKPLGFISCSVFPGPRARSSNFSKGSPLKLQGGESWGNHKTTSKKVSGTPTPTCLRESTAIHLLFVRRCSPHLYRCAFLASKP